MALRTRTPEPEVRDAGAEDEGDFAQEIVDEITWYMRQQKVSRADLAGLMGVSPGRVSQILSGDENLTLRTLNGVVRALGARLDVTLRPEDEPDEVLGDLGYAGRRAAS